MNKEWDLLVLMSENNITTEELTVFNEMAFIASSWWLSNMHIDKFITSKPEIDLEELCKCYEKVLHDEILRSFLQRKSRFGLYHIAGHSSKELLRASAASGVESSYPDDSVMEYNNGELKASVGKKSKVLYSLNGGKNVKRNK